MGPDDGAHETPAVARRGGFLVAILAIVAWSLRTLPAFAPRELTFASAFARCAIMFGIVNASGWLAIDCGLVYCQPRFVVLPGTEGMAGYRDYRFHFRGFLIGIPVVLLASALAAAVVSLLLRARS